MDSLETFTTAKEQLRSELSQIESRAEQIKQALGVDLDGDLKTTLLHLAKRYARQIIAAVSAGGGIGLAESGLLNKLLGLLGAA